jgi:hypothetical protein
MVVMAGAPPTGQPATHDRVEIRSFVPQVYPAAGRL